MAELTELFARLKNPNSSSSSPGPTASSRQSSTLQQYAGYQQPSVSSPIVSPAPQGPQPRHPEHVISAVPTSATNTPVPGNQSRPDQAASLLSLLTASSTPSADQHSHPARSQEPSAPVSASDLVASFARQTQTPTGAADAHASTSSLPLHTPKAASTAATNPQDMLLTLLRRSDSSSHNRSSSADRPSSNNITPVRNFGVSELGQQSPFAPEFHAAKPVFDYHNPFDSLPQSAEKASIATGPSQAAGNTYEVTTGEDLAAERDLLKQVTKDVESVLEGLDAESEGPHRAQKDLKDAVHDVALELSEELRDGKTKHELDEQISKPVAAAIQETAQTVANEGVADTWDAAESEEQIKTGSPGHTVQVYNLPMRPFVSLEVSGAKPPPSAIRPDVVMKIASLKKEFDQVDRTLATASPNHIVYAMTKGGGFRIIRQDDGTNKTVYRRPENQIFNISINASSASEFETVLATGVNGSVFWTAVSPRTDIATEDLEKRSFIFPPPPSPDENTSTAQLKTRAKKSCRHPAFFAYGRSKTIYLVWPNVAQSEQYINSSTRVVDSVKYLNDRCLRIATGKAGKDFAFSEDDSVIVSLDKHGKLKFWDIADYITTEIEHRPKSHIATEIKEPTMTLWISSNSQRAWPTSVQFVDKDRPTTKGLALRYLLVGLKQNHTVQLWDLGLGKAVQELNLPHENETDAICSIAYHSKSGIIAVGHPTRNSLYLIHLSAPRYALPQISQAKYIRALADKDKTMPRPESTAIMSGMREISLAPIGDLRSIDIISSSQAPSDDRDPEDETIFEVYAMHSKGVTCLNLKRADLGWGRDGKVVDARDAERENLVTVAELQVRTQGETGEPEENTTKSTDAGAPKVPPKPASKTEAKREGSETSTTKTSIPATPQRAQANGADKAEKKKKKRSEETENLAADTAQTYANAAQHPPKAVAENAVDLEATTASGSEQSGYVVQPASESRITAPEAQQHFSDLLDGHMRSLYRRIDEDKRVLDATSSARQDAVLRLVSSTLTDNVEKSLSRIVSSCIQESVLPAIYQTTASTLDQKLGQVMSQQLGQAIPREIKAALPEAIAKTLQTPQVLQSIANTVSSRISVSVEKQMTASLSNQVSMSLTNVAAEAAMNASREASRQVEEQMRLAQMQSQNDALKIDKLSQAMGELTSTLTSMAGIQAELQREIALLRGDVRRQPDSGHGFAATGAGERDPELESIAEDIEQSRLEQGTIKWLQSQNQDRIFVRLFRNLDPTYLEGVNQIVVLSVTAAVSQTLTDEHLAERLAWLEVSLAAVDGQSAEIASFAPKMMDILIDRLSEEYMRLTDEGGASARVLSRIHTLVRRAKEIKSLTVVEAKSAAAGPAFG